MGRPRSHDIPPDSPEYLPTWARDIIRAVGKKEARRLLADYREIAEDNRLGKADRDVAEQRAKALERLL